MPVALLMGKRRNAPERLTIPAQPAKVGGEGSVYFTPDRQWMVKLYHRPASDKRELLARVIELGKDLGEDEQFLAWPLGIVGRLDDQARVGVVTRCAPQTFETLLQYIYSPPVAYDQFKAGRTWLDFLKLARGIAAAVRAVHGRGIAHGDVHFKNFLGNPVSGEVMLIDLDGAVVEGFLPPQVAGLPGFMAPEILMGLGKPNGYTDRYSAAVLILWTLLYRNVMDPQTCYDDEDPEEDMRLGYGQHACFSEHHQDRRNWVGAIGVPFFRQGLLSYRMLTPRLQKLTERALIHGLHNPSERPMVVEWEQALAESYDLLTRCGACKQTSLYPYWVQPATRRQCPFCGAPARSPFPAVVELLEAHQRGSYTPVRPVVFYHGQPLFADVLEPGRRPPFTRRDVPRVGIAAFNAKDGVHHLINQSDMPWQVIAGGGGRVARGQSVPLRPGVVVSFGDGKRLARVLE